MIRAKHVVLLCVLASFSSITFAQTVKLQIAAAVPANSPWDMGLRRLAAEWSRISGGRVELSFPRSMANASQDDILQKMRLSLDGGLVETSGLAILDRDYLYLSMPTVIRNDEEFKAAADALMPIMRERLGDRYEAITIAQGGWLYFFSNRPLISPADLVNARIGVGAQQEVLMKQMQAAGARTVKADISNLLLQFNSNTIDIGYTSPVLVATMWSQFRRSVTHMSSFRLSPFFGVLLINKRSWNKIPAELRPALVEAADRIAAEIARDALALEADAIAGMKAQGLLVPPVNAEQAASWNDIFSGSLMRSMLKDWFDPAFTKIIQDAIERTRK